MISQADLETELWAILDKVRRIPPSDRTKGQDPFHQGKAGAAEGVLALIGRVQGRGEGAKLTSAEIRHAERLKAARA